MLLPMLANLLLMASCVFLFFKCGWRGNLIVRGVSLALSLAMLALVCLFGSPFDGAGDIFGLAALYGPAMVCFAATGPIFMMSSGRGKRA